MQGGEYYGGNNSDLLDFFRLVSNVEVPKVCYFGDELVGDVWIPRQFCNWSVVAIVEGTVYHSIIPQIAELESLENELGLYPDFNDLPALSTKAHHKSDKFSSFFYVGKGIDRCC